MNYWLMKTEPETYSWDQLEKDGQTEWTGVRSYEARNNMRKMLPGDLAFIYHSGKEKQIIGIAAITVGAHHDPTDETGIWECVTVAPVQMLRKKVSLNDVKGISICKDMVLLKKSRLSVQSVSQKEWNILAH